MVTAGFVLDLRHDARIGGYIMFFHDTRPEDERTMFDNPGLHHQNTKKARERQGFEPRFFGFSRV